MTGEMDVVGIEDGRRSAGLRARLRAGVPLVGSVLTQPGVALAELLAERLDLVWIDLEHGALSTRDVQPLAIATRAAGSAALVRLPTPDWPALGAILDAGVDGVVVPKLDTPERASRLVERLHRPPRGTRGSASRRWNGYGRRDERETPVLLGQIESITGVENAARIAALDGVDALVVGCADLQAELDDGPRLGSTPLRAAIERVRQAAIAADVAFGVAGPGDPELLLELAGERATIFVHSADVRIYAQAVDAQMSQLRRLLAREEVEHVHDD